MGLFCYVFLNLDQILIVIMDGLGVIFVWSMSPVCIALNQYYCTEMITNTSLRSHFFNIDIACYTVVVCCMQTYPLLGYCNEKRKRKLIFCLQNFSLFLYEVIQSESLMPIRLNSPFFRKYIFDYNFFEEKKWRYLHCCAGIPAFCYPCNNPLDKTFK